MDMFINQFLLGDVRDILPTLPAKTFHTCITSPPYWGLRDYGVAGQLGLEDSPDEYVQNLVRVFREVRRVLRDDGTLWLNLGDAYAGIGRGRYGDGTAVYGRSKQSIGQTAGVVRLPNKTDKLKPKDLIGLPWMVALALRADGWYLRSDIIWHKSNPMPESVKDRPTKSHEYIFLLSKNQKYYYNYEAIMEPVVGFNIEPIAGSLGSFGPPQSRRRKGNRKTFRGGGAYTNNRSFLNNVAAENESKGNSPNLTGLRNKRSVWTVASNTGARLEGEPHYAKFPPDLIEPCVLAGCPEDGLVLDPFMGSGTTAEVALKNNRNFTGIELNPASVKSSKKRIAEVQMKFAF